MPSTIPKAPKADSNVLNKHLLFLWLPPHSFGGPLSCLRWRFSSGTYRLVCWWGCRNWWRMDVSEGLV